MIKELMLSSFGKFKNKKLDFARTTLFIGKNESGKTTIFDALFTALCQPKSTKKAGKQLKERYGEDQDVRVVFEGRSMQIDEDEFLNLYAIRSGDISLNMAGGASWMEKVKSSLFTGGIDPTILRRRFDILSSTSKTYKHNRELLTLEEDLETLQKELNEKKRTRDAILIRENQVHNLAEEITKLEAKRSSLQKECERLNEELNFEKQIIERRRMNDILLRIQQGEKRNAQLEELGSFAHSEIEELDELVDELNVIQSRRAVAAESEKELAERLQTQKIEMTTLEQACARAGNSARIATEYIARAANYSEHLPTTRPQLSWILVVLAIAFVVAGLASFLVLADPLLRVIMLMSGVFAGIMIGVFFILRGKNPDAKRIRTYCLEMVNELAERTGAAMPHPVETIEALKVTLSEFSRKADEENKDLLIAQNEYQDTDNRLLNLKNEIEDLERTNRSQNERILTWLSSKGVKNRDDYIRKVQHFDTLEQEQIGWEQDIARELENAGIQNPELLKHEYERRLRDLDREGLPASGRSHDEVRRLERELEHKSSQIQELIRQISDRKSTAAHERGEIRGVLGNLPEEIISIESALEQKERAVRNLRIDRMAAEMARDFFAQISQDSESMLQELSNELVHYVRVAIPGQRMVKITELDTSSIEVTDSAGDLRTIDHLSKGTQDAFVLAARIALVKRAHPGEGILILDEPFYSLDPERVHRSLSMLSSFQKQNGWQIVILSKDVELRKLVHKVFPHTKTHVLDDAEA